MRNKWPFFWHIFPVLLLINLLTGTVLSFYAIRTFRNFYHQRTIQDLLVRAELLQPSVRSALNDSTSSIDAVVDEVGAATETRITLILADGRVLGDSHEAPEQMDNHADRPEIMEAMTGTTGYATRYSNTLKRTMTYVAVPFVDSTQQQAGVLRVSLPILTLAETFSVVSNRIIWAAVFLSFISVGLSVALARRLSFPLEQLKTGAQRLAHGDLRTSLPRPDTREAAELAVSMSKMAKQLHERIRTVSRQHDEQQAILSSMVEGVIAIDSGEKVLMANAAAIRMLDIPGPDVRGRLIQEVIRNADLQRFIRSLLRGRDTYEREIAATLPGGERRCYEAHGAVISTGDKDDNGVVVVLHDTTRLRRLENIRRDFVANVSHELRTPLTSIKGFVETLMHGGVDTAEDRKHFLGIIANHVNRLNAIIEDLLTISRLERESIEEDIRFEQTAIDGLLKEAVEVCEGVARKRQIKLILQETPGISLTVNGPLLEQAIIDLIDNAIKYGKDASTVQIHAKQNNGNLAISVKDEGPGIESRHLPRIFERFYRIDKARSRKMGGTGLGLSIVKHIVQLHNGSVEVESELGRGSTFTLKLPVAADSTQPANLVAE